MYQNTENCLQSSFVHVKTFVVFSTEIIMAERYWAILSVCPMLVSSHCICIRRGIAPARNSINRLTVVNIVLYTY